MSPTTISQVLGDDEYAALLAVAQRNRMTVRQALRAAISAFVFFDGEVRAGREIRLADASGWDKVDWGALVASTG